MIKKILKQMWVQRRENGWIFLELAIISFFLWKAMDPLYTITTLDNFSKGYTTERALAIKAEGKGTDEGNKDMDRIADAIRLNPMIQDVAVTRVFTYPGSISYSRYSYRSEKQEEWTMIGSYHSYPEYAQSYMNVLEYKDMVTGAVPRPNGNVPLKDICYLSKMAALQLFPDGSNPVGQRVWNSWKDDNTVTVAGVIDDVMSIYGTYEPFIIRFVPYAGVSYGHKEIIARLKSGANPDDFLESFMEKEAPALSTENCKITGVVTFEEMYSKVRLMFGIDGQIRLQCILSFFFLACAFLGIAGTIWMKCNRRRSEIGLYRAMGSTGGGILRMFYTESAAIVTLAYIVALISLAAIILHNNEFMRVSEYIDMTIDNTSPYLYKRFLPHFAIVSLITYAILMGTAFIGTYITVHKYSNIQPSEALRDE